MIPLPNIDRETDFTCKCWHCGKPFLSSDKHDAYCLSCDKLSKEKIVAAPQGQPKEPT